MRKVTIVTMRKVTIVTMRKVTIVTMRKVTIVTTVTMRKVTIVSFFLLQIGLLDLKQRRSLGFLIFQNKQTNI